MSYCMFKEKRVISLDNCVLMLTLVADSSLGNGHGKFSADWGVSNISDKNSLLIPVDIWNEAREALVQRDFLLLNEAGLSSPPTMRSDNYRGNTYRGSRSISSMKSFYSVRNVISIEDLIQENRGGFSITTSAFDCKTYATIGDWEEYFVKDADTLREANEKYTAFNIPEGCIRCVGVHSLRISSRY